MPGNTKRRRQAAGGFAAQERWRRLPPVVEVPVGAAEARGIGGHLLGLGLLATAAAAVRALATAALASRAAR
jgi:hypothetical protein